jgi:mannose-1-phosphate guanylyltransferase
MTNKKLKDTTRDTVKELIPYSNIILEPETKNTTECIVFATLALKERFGEGIVCFVPADGYVKDRNAYINSIELAYFAAERTNDLVIIGITPTYPATGYGYIEIDNDTDAQRISTVLRFIEKPDLKTAKKLVTSGEFMWNGGILVGSFDAILGSTGTLLPEPDNKISEATKHADEEKGTTYVEDAYNEIQNESLDNGVLEKVMLFM